MTPMLMTWRRMMFEDTEVPLVDNDTDVDDVEYEGVDYVEEEDG